MIRPKIITIVAGALAVVGVVGLVAGTALDRAVGEPDLGSRVELDAPVVPETSPPLPVGKATQVAPLPRVADDVPTSKPAKPAEPAKPVKPRGDDDDADDQPSKKAPKAPTDDDRGDDDADDDAGGDDDGGDDGDD